ncbi:hypothetical protein VTN00DRAFT_5404 [Thermoascus crustaceus]|uniref:uncharacterized protein n=1 Tax=Thermoascus crustaceus TaxID=5088 RepID=UPI00374444C5
MIRLAEADAIFKLQACSARGLPARSYPVISPAALQIFQEPTYSSSSSQRRVILKLLENPNDVNDDLEIWLCNAGAKTRVHWTEHARVSPAGPNCILMGRQNSKKLADQMTVGFSSQVPRIEVAMDEAPLSWANVLLGSSSSLVLETVQLWIDAVMSRNHNSIGVDGHHGPNRLWPSAVNPQAKLPAQPTRNFSHSRGQMPWSSKLARYCQATIWRTLGSAQGRVISVRWRL